jgi:hypothetical protein
MFHLRRLAMFGKERVQFVAGERLNTLLVKKRQQTAYPSQDKPILILHQSSNQPID